MREGCGGLACDFDALCDFDRRIRMSESHEASISHVISADGVVSMDALPFTSDRDKALCELGRIMRPGARAMRRENGDLDTDAKLAEARNQRPGRAYRTASLFVVQAAE